MFLKEFVKGVQCIGKQKQIHVYCKTAMVVNFLTVKPVLSGHSNIDRTKVFLSHVVA